MKLFFLLNVYRRLSLETKLLSFKNLYTRRGGSGNFVTILKYNFIIEYLVRDATLLRFNEIACSP